MTASYEVRFAKSFLPDLRSLAREMVPVVVEKVLKLEENPRPPQSRKLRGTTDEYRLRVGHYRVFYTIADDRRLVTVFHVGPTAGKRTDETAASSVPPAGCSRVPRSPNEPANGGIGHVALAATGRRVRQMPIRLETVEKA